MPANSTPAVPRPTPRTFKLPTVIPATHTKARTPMACATGCAACICNSQFIGLAKPPLRQGRRKGIPVAFASIWTRHEIDFDGNDLHEIPILSQLRLKVTSHIVKLSRRLRNPHLKMAGTQAQTAKTYSSPKGRS